MSSKHFRTVEEALDYFQTLESDDSECDTPDICILPPKNGDVTDNEDIDEDELCDVVPRDVSGEIDILTNSSVNEEADFPNVPSTSGTSGSHKTKKRKLGMENPVPSWRKNAEFDKKIIGPDITPLLVTNPELEQLSPIDLFHKIISNDYIKHLAYMSQLYALQKGENVDISTDELCQFFGLLLLSGYHWVPNEKLFWSTAEDTNVPIASTVMSRNRFTVLKKYFHIIDNTKIDLDDRMAKISPFYTELGKRLRQFGNFHKDLSIDESMVPYYGNHSSKMFIRGKPIRFGFKIWFMCSSNGYPYAMDIYCGKSGTQNDPLGERVVKHMVSFLENPKRHEVYFDNFFSSYKLLKSLFDMEVKATGTIRKNRFGTCPLKSEKDIGKKERGSYDYRCDGKIFICRWNDNSVVTVASNHQTHLPLVTAKRYSKKTHTKVDVKQPSLIKMYNQGMGGVDILDQLLSAYRPTLRSKKWWWNLFSNGLNMAVVASWILHRELHGKSALTHLDFRRDITMNLLRRQPKKISVAGPRMHLQAALRAADNHYLVAETQGRCAQCQKNCRNKCVECNKRMHKDCFPLYHGK